MPTELKAEYELKDDGHHAVAYPGFYGTTVSECVAGLMRNQAGSAVWFDKSRFQPNPARQDGFWGRKFPGSLVVHTSRINDSICDALYIAEESGDLPVVLGGMVVLATDLIEGDDPDLLILKPGRWNIDRIYTLRDDVKFREPNWPLQNPRIWQDHYPVDGMAKVNKLHQTFLKSRS